METAMKVRRRILVNKVSEPFHEKQAFQEIHFVNTVVMRHHPSMCVKNQQLRLLLDDTEYWIQNSSFPPLELATRFHHRLVHIHRFSNGNGRHSRIIADAVLNFILNELAIDWAGGYSLEKIGERRTKYIAALRAADKHDMGPLLEFVR